MRIIFSRKGFDSAAGGKPSPIVNGEPISIPIPTEHRSNSTYEQMGLGELVRHVTRGRIAPEQLCHEDPMFHQGRCAFGQTGAAQAHLANQGVGVGDVFLFFGLFADENGQDRHHRIFGYLKAEKILAAGRQPVERIELRSFPRRHPHTIGEWNDNNTIYVGRGTKTKFAHPMLRLSKVGGPISCWIVPAWLERTGLSYHQDPDRWATPTELQLVGRGQEFVATIGDLPEPIAWLDRIIATIEGTGG